jgi:hypothetical protein
MRELVIAALLSGGALFVSQSLPKEEVKSEPVVAELQSVQMCDCCINGEPCTCDPCLCENCPCKQEKVEPIVQRVENDFNASYLESDLDELKSKVFNMQSDMGLLNKKVSELEAKPHLTEEDVKEIVRKEIKIQLELLNTKTNEKVTKTVAVQSTGSEIVLNPGEILTHIDGVPVRGNTQYMSGVSTMNYSTPSFQVTYPQAQPMIQRKATIMPRASVMPRFSSGFSTCGPGGCN